MQADVGPTHGPLLGLGSSFHGHGLHGHNDYLATASVHSCLVRKESSSLKSGKSGSSRDTSSSCFSMQELGLFGATTGGSRF